MASARAQQLKVAALPDFVPVRVPAVRQTIASRLPDVVDITVDSVQLERVRVTGRFLCRHGDVTAAVRQVVVLVRGQRQLVLVLAVDDVCLAGRVVMRRRIACWCTVIMAKYQICIALSTRNIVNNFKAGSKFWPV